MHFSVVGRECVSFWFSKRKKLLPPVNKCRQLVTFLFPESSLIWRSYCNILSTNFWFSISENCFSQSETYSSITYFELYEVAWALRSSVKLPDDSRWLFRAFDRNDSVQKNSQRNNWETRLFIRPFLRRNQTLMISPQFKYAMFVKICPNYKSDR